MINEIMYAISIKLHEIFGDEYEIHQNDIEQGLKEPCFLIVLIDSTKETLLNTRSKRLLPFDIQFFPNQGKSQCHSVSEALMNELEMIECLDGDLMHGTKMRSEIINDVLHFFVSFNYIAKVHEEEIDPMEILEVSNGTKGGLYG